MKKIVLLITLLTSIFCFTACNNQIEDPKQDGLLETSGDASKTENDLVNEESKKILYFYHDSFVGYLENNVWKAPREVMLKEIFDNEFYTVYPTINDKVKSNKIQLFIGDVGYGGFRYKSSEIQSADGVFDDDSDITKYASFNEDTEYIFEIPNGLNDTLNNSYTEDLPDVEMTSVKLIAEGYEYPEDNVSNFISFNAEFDLKFMEESTIEELPADVMEYLKNLLDENGVNRESDYQVMQYFEGDFNNDGINDELFNIVSSDVAMLNGVGSADYNTIDNIAKENGSFSVVITKINGNLSTLNGSYISLEEISEKAFAAGFTANYLINVVDLNEDNIYEMIYSVSGWEYRWYNLAVYNNGEYKNLIKE